MMAEYKLAISQRLEFLVWLNPTGAPCHAQGEPALLIRTTVDGSDPFARRLPLLTLVATVARGQNPRSFTIFSTIGFNKSGFLST